MIGRSKNKALDRRRFHKHDRRANAAVLEHEHEWVESTAKFGKRSKRRPILACLCGATSALDGTDIIEPTTKQLSGYPRYMQ